MIRFANPSKAHAIQIRFYGVVCATLAVCFAGIYWADRGANGHGRADLYVLGYALAFLIFAAGLLAARVWAELMFAFCLSLLAVGDLVFMFVDHARATDISFGVLANALFLIPVGCSVYWLRHGEYFKRGE